MAPRDKDALAARLEKHAGRAVKLLEALTASSPGAEAHGQHKGQDGRPHRSVMPKTAVTHAAALAFVFRRKAGAVLGLMRERAFLVARLISADGTSLAWSGPVFCCGHGASLGLTAGFSDLRILLAVSSEEAMQEVLRPYCSPGANAVCLADMNGSRLRPVHTRGTAGELQARDAGPPGGSEGGIVAQYYEVNALLLDVSVRGVVFRLDSALNAAVYGPRASPAEVLTGRVPPPPQFAPLYRLLHEYARQAGGMRLVPSVAHLVSRSPSTSPRLHSYAGLPSAARSMHGARSTQGVATQGSEAVAPSSAPSSVADAEEEREEPRGAAAAAAAAGRRPPAPGDEPSIHGLVSASPDRL